MNPWDALTWVAVAALGPGVLALCVWVAHDVRRLLGAAPPAAPDPDPDTRDPPPP
jgi:hypothetical protein